MYSFKYNGWTGEIWTHNPLNPNQVHYQVVLQLNMVAGEGLEPPTFRLWAWQATTANILQ